MELMPICEQLEVPKQGNHRSTEDEMMSSISAHENTKRGLEQSFSTARHRLHYVAPLLEYDNEYNNKRDDKNSVRTILLTLSW